MKLQSELRGSLESIFSNMVLAFHKGHVDRKSVMAADIVTVGDSWLPLAIRKGLIEPICDAEGQSWFNSLDDKWKVRRLCPIYLKIFRIWYLGIA